MIFGERAADDAHTSTRRNPSPLTAPRRHPRRAARARAPPLPPPRREMASSAATYTTADVYRSVVEDVVGRVRSDFVGEGVDE